MKTTIDFLDGIKESQGVDSDYMTAKLLGVTRATVSRYRCGLSHFDDATAMKAANLLGIDAGYVIACAHRERAKTAEEKAVWTSMLERLGGLAAAILLAPALLMAPAESRAATYDSCVQEAVIFRI